MGFCVPRVGCLLCISSLWYRRSCFGHFRSDRFVLQPSWLREDEARKRPSTRSPRWHVRPSPAWRSRSNLQRLKIVWSLTKSTTSFLVKIAHTTYFSRFSIRLHLNSLYIFLLHTYKSTTNKYQQIPPPLPPSLLRTQEGGQGPMRPCRVSPIQRWSLGRFLSFLWGPSKSLETWQWRESGWTFIECVKDHYCLEEICNQFAKCWNCFMWRFCLWQNLGLEKYTQIVKAWNYKNHRVRVMT